MHLRFLSGISLAILAICVAAGCAAISEAGRGIAGMLNKNTTGKQSQRCQKALSAGLCRMQRHG